MPHWTLLPLHVTLMQRHKPRWNQEKRHQSPLPYLPFPVPPICLKKVNGVQVMIDQIWGLTKAPRTHLMSFLIVVVVYRVHSCYWEHSSCTTNITGGSGAWYPVYVWRVNIEWNRNLISVVQIFYPDCFQPSRDSLEDGLQKQTVFNQRAERIFEN